MLKQLHKVQNLYSKLSNIRSFRVNLKFFYLTIIITLNSKLKEKNSSYETNIGEYYQHIEQVKYDWYDENSERFYQDVPGDRKNDFNIIEEIKSISKIYDYLINNYKTIGNIIEYDPTKKDDILETLDDMISTITVIINNYNNIEIQRYPERNRLYRQQNSFIEMKTKIKDLRRKLKTDMNKIDEIENNSQEKFKKVTISRVDNKDIRPYMKGWDKL